MNIPENPDYSQAPPLDNSNRDEVVHDLSVPEKAKNFDQKIYMFPESYNALRRELVENWEELWGSVGWAMANKAELFVESMNMATDLKLVFDTEKVSYTCDQYLQRLRKMRGLQ